MRANHESSLVLQVGGAEEMGNLAKMRHISILDFMFLPCVLHK